MFGQALADILSRLDRSASWLGRKVDRDAASVLRWTAGQTLPGPTLLPLIRDALAGSGATVDELGRLDAAYLGRPAADADTVQ